MGKIVNGVDLADPIQYITKFFKVKTKADESGLSQLIPMELWPAQRFYIENRTKRDIVLKGRQMGISTGVMAANAHRCFSNHYQSMVIITHKQDVSTFLLQTVSRFLRNLPDGIRPTVDWHSGKHIRLPKLDSLIHIDSAESDSIGFGETLNMAHLSEMGRWPHAKAKELFDGMSQSVSLGGFITIESTPRGRQGLFYDLYQSAKKGENPYKTFFFPWWYDPDYKIPTNGRKLELNKEEEQLTRHFSLTPEQILWRRNKISEIHDNFYQEYPENDVDCWLSGDISVFDGMAIRRYLQQSWPGKQEGNLTIWKDVIGGEKYVIGVDVAGGKKEGDWSVASVLSIKRNEYVARLRDKKDPDLFAQDLLRLGNRYNDAEIAVERIGHGQSVITVLLNRNYPNIYYHIDPYDPTPSNRDPGWRTSHGSKPVMVSGLAMAMRSNDISLWSENFCNEAAAYIYDGTSDRKYRKGQGADDDELDAVMIALQVREQTPISDTSRYRPTSYARI